MIIDPKNAEIGSFVYSGSPKVANNGERKWTKDVIFLDGGILRNWKNLRFLESCNFETVWNFGILGFLDFNFFGISDFWQQKNGRKLIKGWPGRR